MFFSSKSWCRLTAIIEQHHKLIIEKQIKILPENKLIHPEKYIFKNI